MSDPYRMLRLDDAPRTVSGKSETEITDLTADLGLEEMRARIWHLEPGNTRKSYHRHGTQEELYYVLEGPGRIRIEDEVHDAPPATVLRLPPETPRQILNDTDEPAVWLVVGAPPVENDGQPLETP